MTPKEYNTNFHPKLNNALSFINCIDHALEKSDDNAKMQMRVIGWNEETRDFICEALYVLREMKLRELHNKE